MPRLRPILLLLATLLLGAPAARAAEQIVVSNYGVAANGMPYAVAMEKGFFQQEGADISGILSSSGGGTTVRIMLGGNLAYGEIDLAGTVAAIQGGADLRIVSDNVLTTAEFAWAAKKGSPIKALADLKGHKIGYTNPKSTSQALDVLLLETIGLKPTDAELVRVGGFGEQIVALNLGSIDVATLADPVWSKNAADLQPIVFAADVLPPLCNVIGVTTGAAANAHPDFVRAIIRGRRKAVEFMYAHPDDAGEIIAKVYNLEPAVVKAAVNRLTTSHAKSGVHYWGPGGFDFAGMDRMIHAQTVVGAFTGTADWSKLVDTSFLPDDLKPHK